MHPWCANPSGVDGRTGAQWLERITHWSAAFAWIEKAGRVRPRMGTLRDGESKVVPIPNTGV